MSSIAMKGRFADPIITALIDTLVAQDRDRIKRTLSRLVERNHAAGNSPIGFLFAGNFHSVYDKVTQGKAPKKALDPGLNQEGLDYVAALKELELNEQRLKSGLSLLLRPCKDWQDVRDALPDVVRDELAEIRSLPRTRPEGWTLEAFPLQHMQFEMTSNLLAYYIANRMLY